VIEVVTPGGGGASILYQTSGAHGFANGEGVTTSSFERGKYNRTDDIETGGSCSIGTAGGGACDTDEFEMNDFGSAPASVDDLAIRAVSADGVDVVYTTGSGSTSVPHQLADLTRVRITGFTPSGYNGNFVIQTFGSCSTGTGTAGACTASELEVVNSTTGAVTTPGGVNMVFGTASSDNPVASVVVHDSENAVWRRGAARTVQITADSSSANTFSFPTGELHGVRDLGRPISDPGVTGTLLRDGTFIRTLTTSGGGACTTNCAKGTLSQTAAAAGTTTDALVEHTSSFVTFANCPVPPATQFGPDGGPFSNLNVATRSFDADDIGLSVSGGPFAHGARIAALGDNPNRVLVEPSPFDGVVSCSQARPLLHPSVIDRFTIGAADYGTATGTDYSTQYEETYTRTIQRDSGDGYSCSGTTMTLGSEGGEFNSYDIHLPVEFSGTGAATRTITAVTSSTTATLSGTCAGSSSRAVIGEASASAPADGSTVMTLGATLQLNPALVPEQDDCSAGTPEGFMVVGLWQNPGSYTPAGTDPIHSIGQITFPTALVSFNAYLVTVPGGDGQQPAAHYDVVLPAFPTSTAVCPGTATAITLGLNPTTRFDAATSVPSGSGNPAGPSVRSLGPQLSSVAPFGTFNQVIEINDSLGDPVASSPYTSTACTITSPAAIDFACGDD
jgi:hypothetical protein